MIQRQITRKMRAKTVQNRPKSVPVAIRSDPPIKGGFLYDAAAPAAGERPHSGAGSALGRITYNPAIFKRVPNFSDRAEKHKDRGS